ncbi:MAG: HIRAN domain-containing protein [Burkholderiales bacterium]|nr:HIRAN domain-containing protein [Burkholderiales bacterium]
MTPLIPTPAQAPSRVEAAEAVPVAGVRARLWVPGRLFGPQDDDARLWLLLTDGRVLAFRLPGVRLGDDGVLAALAAAVADDPAGRRWAVEHAVFGWAQVLYAAPVLPALRADHAGYLFTPEFARFASGLDGEVMRLLLDLEREPTPPAITRHDGEAPHPLPRRFYASVRNYNRLATLPHELRVRRLQALTRFPALVAPILLTAHAAMNVWDGCRHARRSRDAAVEAAIDAGRDLTGALARHYGISRALVRDALNTRLWPAAGEAARRRCLHLLDALPADRRPSLAEFERWQPYLANYFRLLGLEAGDATTLPPQVHRGAFHLGWTRTWQTAARRHGDLHVALADCGDFLRAARARSAQRLHRRYGPGMARLAAAWLAQHGLLGLLAASERWHRLRPRPGHWGVPPGYRLPAILDRVCEDGCTATELLTPAALAREGDEMAHCAAAYWPQSVDGERLFALRLASGERATAQYRPDLRLYPRMDAHYVLVQLRGPHNAAVGPALHAWAKRIETRLNEPLRRSARLQALQAREQLALLRQRAPDEAAWLDARSERQLEQALAWLKEQPLGADTLLCTYIAGYAYHAGPRLEHRLAPGDTLGLVREPDNPHDRLAVRIDWQGCPLGYVPRNENAEIAARLDAGEALAARIVAVEPSAEPWARVLFAVTAAATILPA